MTLLYLFGIIVAYKVIRNAVSYTRCQRYLKLYQRWLEEPDWSVSEIKFQVIELFDAAGLEDRFSVEAVGPGFAQVAKVSVLNNFASRRQTITTLILDMFHSAIGVYRARMWEALNPLYWLDLVVCLPKHVFRYLGISAKDQTLKVVQFTYRALGLAAAFFYGLYKSEIDQLVRGWIDRLLP